MIVRLLVCAWFGSFFSSHSLTSLLPFPLIYYRDPKHVNWAKAVTAVYNDLQAYVKQYHTTGLKWGNQVRKNGGDRGTDGNESERRLFLCKTKGAHLTHTHSPTHT